MKTEGNYEETVYGNGCRNFTLSYTLDTCVPT